MKLNTPRVNWAVREKRLPKTFASQLIASINQKTKQDLVKNTEIVKIVAQYLGVDHTVQTFPWKDNYNYILECFGKQPKVIISLATYHLILLLSAELGIYAHGSPQAVLEVPSVFYNALATEIAKRLALSYGASKTL